MLSSNAKIYAVIVAAISVLAVAAVSFDSDADGNDETTYRFLLTTTIDTFDNSICGWHEADGTSVVDAFCNMLDKDKITYTGFTSESSSVWFSDEKYFSNWIGSEWGSYYDEDFGLNYGIQPTIWNYNSTDGWVRGNTFGTDSDTIYIISFDRHYNLESKAAVDVGVDTTDAWGDPAAYDLQYTGNVYSDAREAAAVYYFIGVMEGDEPSDYGLALVDSPATYDDLDDAVTDYLDTYDPLEYVYDGIAGIGVDADMVSYGMPYFFPAPIDLAATPDSVVLGNYYSFKLNCMVDDQDQTVNGWYSAFGTSVVDAFCNALDLGGVTYSGFTNTDPSISFKSNYISTWTKSWDSEAADVIGANFGIWNYNPNDGWFLGNTFGTDSDRTYIINLENFYQKSGTTATSLGGVLNSESKLFVPLHGTTAPYGSWLQSAPVDLMANPASVEFGWDADDLADYTLILSNTVAATPILNTYEVKGDSPVIALAAALWGADIDYSFNPYADSVYFSQYGDGIIADWETSWDSKAADVIGANYAIWNYNTTDGWYCGNSFGMDSDTTYYISYENYYTLTGTTATGMGIVTNTEGSSFLPIKGAVIDYFWIKSAPVDYDATVADVEFGWDTSTLQDYTMMVSNTVAATPTLNTYEVKGDSPVIALAAALFQADIAFTFDPYAESVFFGSKYGGMIADWDTAWDTTAEDILGANYAIWCYNSTDGWFLSNGFGLDEETVYYISYENYYQPNGPTAKTLGASMSTSYVACLPIPGIANPWSMNIQVAPRDYSATPDTVVFGADTSGLQDYTLILINSVAGTDQTPAGTYTVKGTTPVNALANALNYAGISYTFKWDDKSVYFSTSEYGQGIISDWADAWDSSAADCIGANYAIWNYNSTDGWFTGQSFGMDDETVYIISYENYYQADGVSAAAMGVTVEGSTITAPAGLVNPFGNVIQLAPMDYSATPENVEFKPFYFVTFVLNNGEADQKAAGYEGATVTAVADPTRDGCTFYKWDPSVPSTFTELDYQVEAVWKVTPVEKDKTVEVDLTAGDTNFDMPDTDKSVTVTFAENTSVVLDDSSALAGKTVTASIEAVDNPSSIEGTAYEFTFEAEGSAYSGKLQVTVPYTSASGKIPVVYYVDAQGTATEMTLVSYTSTSVTFETDHNSTYVVGYANAPTEMLTIAAIAIFVAIIILVVVWANASRKQWSKS